MGVDGSTDIWVALLRGVNVGGANRVPMAALCALAAELGWRDVRSYIASGNLVFCANGEAAQLARALRAAMVPAFDVDVPVRLLSGAAICAARDGCPFAPDEGRQVHAFFLWEPPAVDNELLAAMIAPTERFAVAGDVVWLYAPEGVARSKLAERMARVLGGAEFTARNLNTVRMLARMVEG